MDTTKEADWTAEPCRNCGDPGRGRYCRQCGQRKGEVRVSMRRLLADVLEDQLSINAALPRTLGALFLHPGRLTAEYARGRIASYIAPFRLYLVSSLIFFLTLSFMSRSSDFDNVSVDVGDVAADTTATLELQTGNTRLDSVIAVRIQRLEEMGARQAIATIISSLLQRAPTAMFLMLPLFALLLKLLYVRTRTYYVEHFVFALHYHAFAFLLFTVMLLLEGTYISPVLLLWLILYMPIALKRVYGQGAVITMLKWFAMSTAYAVLLAFALVGTLIATVLLL